MWYSFRAQECAFSYPPIVQLGTRKQCPTLLTLIKKSDTHKTHPPIAQPVEQLPFKEKVPGSIPGGRTNLNEVKIWTHKKLFGKQFLRDRSPCEISFRLEGRKVSAWGTGHVMTDSLV